MTVDLDAGLAAPAFFIGVTKAGFYEGVITAKFV